MTRERNRRRKYRQFREVEPPSPSDRRDPAGPSEQGWDVDEGPMTGSSATGAYFCLVPPAGHASRQKRDRQKRHRRKRVRQKCGSGRTE
ncbi:hypothetical protein GCM10018790_47260 [Kitasatospora xanthocidica]|nr:hypothetical protein GCM10018790_47260 [Kitasatospora xanthocidica]